MKIELKIWVYADIFERWNADTSCYVKDTVYRTVGCDLTESGYAMVSRDPMTVFVDIPDNFDIVGAKIEGLKAQIKKEEGECFVKVENFKRQINDLLMLPAPTVTSKPEDDFPF